MRALLEACCLGGGDSPQHEQPGGGRKGACPEHGSLKALPASALQLEGLTLVHAAGIAPNVEQGRNRLGPLDHSAILACINPKAMWLPYGLDATTLRAALAHTLRDFPPLAGRLVHQLPPAAAPARAAGATNMSRGASSGAGDLGNISGTHGSNDGGGVGSLRAYQPPRTAPRSVSTSALAPAMRQQAYCVVMCNAGAGLRVAYAPQWRLQEHFTLAAMGRTGFHCGPGDPQPRLPPWFEPMDVCAMLGGRAPPLLVRLTHLGCGGCILATTFSHAVMDGRSVCMFLTALASHYRRLSTAGPVGAPPPPPCLNRDLLLLPAAGNPTTPSAAGSSNGSVGRGARAATPTPPVFHVHASAAASPAARSQAAGLVPETGMTVVPSQASKAAGAPRAAAADASKLSSHTTMRVSTLGGASPRKHDASTTAAGADSAFSAPLQCLGLQALPCQPAWRPALTSLMQTVRAARAEEALWPGLQSQLTCSILHCPQHTVAHVKALASQGGSCANISTNDAMTALLWVVVCQLRRRPLPGHAPPGCANALGMAVDLRMNGLAGHLPLNLVANATWCIHVASAGPPATPVTAGACAPPPLLKPEATVRAGTPVTVHAACTAVRAVDVPSVLQPGSLPAVKAAKGAVAVSGAAPSDHSSSGSSSSSGGGSIINPPGTAAAAPAQPQARPQQPSQQPQSQALNSLQDAWTRIHTGGNVSSSSSSSKQLAMARYHPRAAAAADSSWLMGQKPLLSVRSLLPMTPPSQQPQHQQAQQYYQQQQVLARLASGSGSGVVPRQQLVRSCSAAAALMLRQGSCGVPAGPVGEGTEQQQDELLAPGSKHVQLAKEQLSGAGGGGAFAGAQRQHHGDVDDAGSRPAAAPWQCPLEQQGKEEEARGSEQYVSALREGAARIRAALLELRGTDAVTTTSSSGGHTSSDSSADSTSGAGGGEGTASQLRGWAVLQHAKSLTTAPLAAQVHLAARVYGGQDVMVTSWQFPYWTGVDFGQGGPARLQGLLCPSPSWAAAIMQAHPAEPGGGLYCMVVTPTSAVSALRDSIVLRVLAPGAYLATM